MSFRNIQNENYLIQKNFEENRASLQKELEDALEREQAKIFQETKAASLFLYELPKSLLEFGNAASFKDVQGIEAIFLFNNGTLVYPDISSKLLSTGRSFSDTKPTLVEKALFQTEREGGDLQEIQYSRETLPRFPLLQLDGQIQNALGLIRLAYKSKQYNRALRMLIPLENGPSLKGYLHSNLTRSLNLLHFEILVKMKKHQEAEEYCLAVLKQFLQEERIEDIPSTKFFFESAFTQILSFENLSQEKREAFWNLRSNFNRQLGYTDILVKNKDLFQNVLASDPTSKDGISFRSEGNVTLLKMSYPMLSGNQVVIAKINNDTYRERILDKLRIVAQRWNNVPFSITDSRDSLLLGAVPDSANILLQTTFNGIPTWELSLYEKDVGEIRKESRHRMLLMYGLLSFSLITVIFGSFFMLRFIVQEHKLLAMKANFLSSVSHELKTPLTSIKMFAEMMARGRVQKTEKVQEYSGLIGKEASRLENLIGAILNYTRMEHGTGAFKWEKLDFSVCAKKVFEAVEDIGVEKGLSFKTRFEPNVYVMGDYTALYSLAQNLIENAIKYTNAPGDIEINVYNEDDRAVFSVIDTGVGIAASEQKNIFNDFYRVGDEMTRSTKGSGLGLAIVKRVAETHKATISLSSKPGKGSNFTIRFRKVE